MMQKGAISLFGYSGHAYVAADIFNATGHQIGGYLTAEPAVKNPYNLDYLGFEENTDDLDRIAGKPYFVAVGDNFIRRKISEVCARFFNYPPVSAVHPSSAISTTATIGSGVMVGTHTAVNACARIGNGVICNTAAVIEHECRIGNFAHIAPGTVLCGNVTIGENTLVGAGSVVIPGITVGKNVTIGAGTVVTKNIPDNMKVVGNPQRFI